MGSQFLWQFLVIWLVLTELCVARPRPSGEKVTMSGEPTHFQVDDKAAELEINANAMGVKVNAKPASLQVVSKPGAPSVPVAHPAVVVPQLPAPYLNAPYYPSPMVIGRRRTTRRHHFFMDAGNYNNKKNSVPFSARNSNPEQKFKNSNRQNAKRSKIASGSKKNAKKRAWIQPLPVQLVTPVPRMRIQPLLQPIIAGISQQGYSRQIIPHFAGYQSSAQVIPQQMYTVGQQLSRSFPTPLVQRLQNVAAARRQVSRSLLVPPSPALNPIVLPNPMAASFVPMFAPGVPYHGGPGLARGPVSGYNGFYDPILSRDFIPDMAMPGYPRIPIPRAIIPGGIPGGINYPGYTPLGAFRFSKRVSIPKHSSTKNTVPKTSDDIQTIKSTTKREVIPKKKEQRDVQIESLTRKRRSNIVEKAEITRPSAKQQQARNDVSVAKRQYILTRPAEPQVTYVPVVSGPQTRPITTSYGNRRNLLFNLPATNQANSALVLSAPLGPQSPPQMYQAVPSDPQGSQMYEDVSSAAPVGKLYPAMTTLSNNDVMGQQRSTGQGWELQVPGIQQFAGMQMPGIQRSGIQAQVPWNGNGMISSLSQLSGIQGQGTMVQRQPYRSTLYTTDPLPSPYQDQLIGQMALQGRTRIARRLHRPRYRNRYESLRDDDDDDREYAQDSEDRSSAYEHEPTRSSGFDRIDDDGSYSERRLPDGRTMLTKDHVGIGPITVEAKTAEAASRDRDTPTDMDLDSDKRKQIPRPTVGSYLDKRLGIPKPER